MKAYGIRRPDTAFSVDRQSRQRRPRDKAEDHLKFLRKLPCCICGVRMNIHAAHIRARSTTYNKPGTGLGERPHDRWTVPLCAQHHTDDDEAQHKGNELTFWLRHKIDPFILALKLYGCTGHEEEAEAIIAALRKS